MKALKHKMSLPDARDKHGNTFLMLAVKHQNLELIQYFFDEGVELFLMEGRQQHMRMWMVGTT